MGYKVSLRRSEAELVEVVSVEEAKNLLGIEFNGVIDEETLKVSAIKKGKVINVALVGNPNCGKTTLFNFASGSHERVGNYGGVTVDSKEATLKKTITRSELSIYPEPIPLPNIRPKSFLLGLIL